MLLPSRLVRLGLRLAIVSVALGLSAQGVIGASAVARGLGDGVGQRAGAPGLPPDRPDDLGKTPPPRLTPTEPLESRELALGGFFIGNMELGRPRPIPGAAPTHEEMKAVATPPEFRTPPAVSFGWSWRGRR